MSRWIERLSSAERAEWVDAGRIGPSRFDGPRDPSEEVTLEWCDGCRTYQLPGHTRPMEAGSRYRICRTCDSRASDEATDAYREAGFDAMTPLGQRYWDGDR